MINQHKQERVLKSKADVLMATDSFDKLSTSGTCKCVTSAAWRASEWSGALESLYCDLGKLGCRRIHVMKRWNVSFKVDQWVHPQLAWQAGSDMPCCVRAGNGCADVAYRAQQLLEHSLLSELRAIVARALSGLDMFAGGQLSELDLLGSDFLEMPAPAEVGATAFHNASMATLFGDSLCTW